MAARRYSSTIFAIVQALALYSALFVLIVSKNTVPFQSDNDQIEPVEQFEDIAGTSMLLLHEIASNPKILETVKVLGPSSSEGTGTKSSFDILVVGSMYQQQKAEKQFQTWGSHASVRHFILATENDDPDLPCHNTTTPDEQVYRTAESCT